jgi:hypothetical protein
MDEINDNIILRAGGLPIASPDSLTHLTSFTLRSLLCDLDGLDFRRFGGLAVRRKVHSSASGRGHPGLFATYRVGRSQKSGWLASSAPSRTLTTGLPRSRLPLISTLRACFGLSTSPVGSHRPSATLSIWTTRLLIARHGARESEGQKLTSSPRDARSTASASTLWFNSSICESASQKPSGCGATASNDQAVGLLDRAVSKPTQLPFPGPNIRCLSAYAY